MGLGLFYFGGLWLTVRRLPGSRTPELLILGSFVGRLAVTLAGFYLVMGGRWERLLACLAGFLITRTFLLYRLKPTLSAPLPCPLPQGERDTVRGEGETPAQERANP
jgi:F1F0 ATPase subunit 2